MDDRDNKNYITSRVHPIFEKMIIDLLLVKPDDLVDYMISWLQDKGSQFKVNNAVQNNQQTKDSHNTSKLLGKLKAPTNEDIPSSGDDSENDLEEEEEENMNPKSLTKIMHQKQRIQTRRNSVSAEVYGLFNKRQPLQIRIIQKRNEQKERIMKKINSLFMFASLEDKERNQLADSMEEKRLRPGEFLFRQGEYAESMYIVEQGQLDGQLKQENGEAKVNKSYSAGDSVGELALLYIKYRTNSVVAKNDALLWQLDRSTFNQMVRESAINKKKKYEQLFSRIGLLQAMDLYEKTQISDAIRQLKYAKGEYVVKQGEQGDMFFMVEDGELVALKQIKTQLKLFSMNVGGEPEQVMSYKSGQYFGELALIKNQPRQASVLCKSNCKLLALDRYSFKRLLGPAEVILKRNTEIYESIKQ